MPKDNLSGRKLDHINLSGTNLSEADLSHASLRQSQLKGAKLQNANLADSDLRGAHLEHADLTGAHLEHADLSGADLTGVDLGRVASLEGATLAGTMGVTDLPEVKINDDRVVSVRWEGAPSADTHVDRLLASVVELNGQMVESVQAVRSQRKDLTENEQRAAIEAIHHARQQRDEMEGEMIRVLGEVEEDAEDKEKSPV